jgi:hypothetical protein
MSQDHLKLFFSSIRACGRLNNNPSAQNFKHAYKKLLLSEVKDNADNVTSQGFIFQDGSAILAQNNISKYVQLHNYFTYSDQ